MSHVARRMLRIASWAPLACYCCICNFELCMLQFAICMLQLHGCRLQLTCCSMARALHIVVIACCNSCRTLRMKAASRGSRCMPHVASLLLNVARRRYVRVAAAAPTDGSALARASQLVETSAHPTPPSPVHTHTHTVAPKGCGVLPSAKL